MSIKRDMPPSFLSILKSWNEHSFADIGEPACFACGMYDHTFDLVDKKLTEKNVEVAWSKNHFEKAHIIPHALGGSNDPPNYVILCKACHSQAPNIKNRRLFIEWVLNYSKNAWRQSESIVAQYLSDEDTRILSKMIINKESSKILDEWLSENDLGPHPGSDNLGSANLIRIAITLRSFLDGNPEMVYVS